VHQDAHDAVVAIDYDYPGAALAGRPNREDSMPKLAEPQFIESTAGEVAAELARRGIASNQRVTITIEADEPDDWISEARRFARPKEIAEGW
jgi:hypothetical protein